MYANVSNYPDLLLYSNDKEENHPTDVRKTTRRIPITDLEEERSTVVNNSNNDTTTESRSHSPSFQKVQITERTVSPTVSDPLVEMNEKLDSLSHLGYTNRTLNRYLLEFNQCNLEEVISILQQNLLNSSVDK